MIREPAQTIVLFDKNGISPMCVVCSRGIIKVNKVIKSWRERRNLHECIIYLCHADDRCDPVELRWDTIINMWFVEKL